GQEVGGSNPLSPTIKAQVRAGARQRRLFCFWPCMQDVWSCRTGVLALTAMQWVAVGEPELHRQRGKWVVRVSGYDPATGRRRVRQLGTFETKRAAGGSPEGGRCRPAPWGC